jgi:hypothetical protein
MINIPKLKCKAQTVQLLTHTFSLTHTHTCSTLGFKVHVSVTLTRREREQPESIANHNTPASVPQPYRSTGITRDLKLHAEQYLTHSHTHKVDMVPKSYNGGQKEKRPKLDRGMLLKLYLKTYIIKELGGVSGWYGTTLRRW